MNFRKVIGIGWTCDWLFHNALWTPSGNEGDLWEHVNTSLQLKGKSPVPGCIEWDQSELNVCVKF